MNSRLAADYTLLLPFRQLALDLRTREHQKLKCVFRHTIPNIDV